MKTLFNKIIISSIYTAKHNGFMSDIWRFASVFYFSVASVFFMVFFYSRFNHYIYELNLDIILDFGFGNSYNFITTLFLFFLCPIYLFVHFKFIHRNKYKLMKEYTTICNKSAFAWYFMLAFVAVIAILFI